MSPIEKVLWLIGVILVCGTLGFFSFRDFIRAEYGDNGQSLSMRWIMLWVLMLVCIIGTIYSFYFREN